MARKGKQYRCCLLTSKAFDMMQPRLLIHAMKDLQVPTDLTNITFRFLRERTKSLSSNKTASSEEASNVGIPQGALCGRWFWGIFSPIPVKSIRYADDTTCFLPRKQMTTLPVTAVWIIDLDGVLRVPWNYMLAKMMRISHRPGPLTAEHPTVDDIPWKTQALCVS